MGDDIGYWNISAYNRGMMGTIPQTLTALPMKGRYLPTIMANSRARRAGRPSSPAKARSALGLLKVGLPGAKEGLSAKDPTIAKLLKPQGYATGQFGGTISAIAMSFCPRCTALMNSSATLII